jgi:MFS family permease
MSRRATRPLAALHGRTFKSIRDHRNYRLYFVGQLVSFSGSWMQDAALPWLVYELTHSATAVGLTIFFRLGPSTILSLFVGDLADRFDNRRFLMATQIGQAVPAAITAVLVLSGGVELWQIYALTFLGGVATAAEGPNRSAIVYQLVGRQDLPNAVALNASLVNSARAVGPGLGGVVIATIGAGWCFAINAASVTALVGALAMMRVDELVPVPRETGRPAPLRGFAEAFRFFRSAPQLRALLGLVAVIGIAGFNIRVLLPVLSSKTLDASPETFGILYAVFGVGALIGALATATRGRATPRAVLVSAGLLACSMLALAPLHSIAGAAMLLFVLGTAWSVFVSNTSATMQLSAPDHLRGRVLGFQSFCFVGLQPIGGLLTGWFADIGGTELAFFVSGAAIAAATVWAASVVRGSRGVPAAPIPAES